MCFSLNPHSISIHSHFYPSSLTLSTLCHSSLPSFHYFLFASSSYSLLFSFSLSSHFITSHFTSSFSLSPLSYYSSFHSNHIHCLLSSSHLHHAHHIAYSSIIHPTSSSFHSPSIPSFSHFSLFHSSISPWCSSRFPQNSFSLISFIILSYSLFHTPFHTSSTPSPSSPHIPDFHSHSHPYSLFIHYYSFPSHSSSYPLLSHSLLSISIPVLSFHSISSFLFICYFSFDSSFSHVQWYHRPSLFTVLILFIQSYPHFSFPFISFLRLSSSFLYYEIVSMFIRIVVIACSFVLLIGNTISQLDVIAFASDV